MNPDAPATPAGADAAAPLTASLMEQVAAKGDGFNLRDFREAKDKPAEPAVPTAETVGDPTSALEPKGDIAGSDTKSDPNPASEAGKALAAHKSGLDKRKTSIQQEIDALTHDKHATRREIEAAKAELDGIKAQIATAKGAKPATETPAVDADDPEPQEEAYERYGDYVKAQSRWAGRQEAKALLETERGRSAQATGQQRRAHAISTFNTELQAEIAKRPALKDTLDAAGDMPLSPLMEFAIVTSSRRIELVEYLATHREDAQAFSALAGDPRAVQRLMESRLAAPGGPAQTVKPQTKAQEPIKPLGAQPTASAHSLESVVGTGTTVSLRRLREVSARR